MFHGTDDVLSIEEQLAEPLGRGAILSYGFGHVLNDFTSACWFTYLLVFLTDIGFQPSDAAIVMLSGQIADAFATIFAGELIDRFGHFKLWHAGGSILVAISFSSVFGGCLPCELLRNNSAELETIDYSIFAAIFNVGWAITQVSHMSMVTCITLHPSSQVALASCRNAFTMVANLGLYAVAFAVFTELHTANFIDQYRWIAYVSIFIGCCFVGLFLIGTKEPPLRQHSQCADNTRISWFHWFRNVLYYQVALVYTLTRLVTNVSQALLAFYVINDLGMDESSKALVPAIIYISSFITSIIFQEMRWSNQHLKTLFIIGAIFWIFSAVAMFLLPSEMHNYIYAISIVVGAANAFMLVTAVSMEGILVSEELNGCAFVYGSLSFLDKLSCGVALYIIELYQGHYIKGDRVMVADSYSVTRLGISLLPAVWALLSAIVAYSMDLPDNHRKPSTAPLLA